MSVVKAAYGPSLPELLGPRRWRALAVAGVVLGVAALAAVLWPSSERVIVARGPVAFNFIYGGGLAPAGAAKVEQRVGSVFVQSMEVDVLRLPAYRGDPGGTLPILADRLTGELSRRYAGFQVVSEGRARINENPGYGISWIGRVAGRRIFGRDYLLVPDEPAPRAGARVALRSTYRGGVSSALDVGAVGPLKRSLRSFRFGTERP